MNDALANLERAAFTIPPIARYWAAGQIYFDAGDFELAAAAFRNLVETGPNHAAGQYNLALCYYRLGRFEEAQAAFETAQSLNPESVETLRGLAAVAIELGDLDQAVTCCGKLHCSALEYNLALALQLEHRLTEAVEHYRRGLEYSPGLVEAWINLGHALTALGLPFEAAQAWQKALELNPNLRS